MKFKFLAFSLLILLSSTGISASAQDDTTDHIYMVGFESDSIRFYASDSNKLTEVGALPTNFSVQDLNPTAEWVIGSRLHLSVSPDGQYIAFTAKRSTEAALFIYTLTTNALNQIPVVSSTLTPLWSPDSDAIALEPLTPFFESSSPYPETFIYERTSGLLSQITNSPDFIETLIHWLPDSSGILYATRCESPCGRGIDEFHFSDRQGNNQYRFTDSAILPEDFIGNACNLTWNPIDDRWYFQVGCLSVSDRTQDRVFSTNLQGDTQQELVLQDIFTDELIMARAIRGIGIASDGDVYLGLYIHSGIGADWYLSELMVPGQTQNVFYQRFEGNNWSELEQVVFSPNGERSIMVGMDSPGRNQAIKVVNTTNGQVIFQHTVPGPNTVCSVRWLDSQRFVFEETLYGCNVNAEVQNVWLVDTATGTITDASQGIPNLIGLLQQPEKPLSFVEDNE